MKLHNFFRMQAIVVGFAAALLLASSTPAQEIENTNWDDGPNVAPLAQPAPTVNDLNSAVTPAAVVSEPVANRESIFAQGNVVLGPIIAFLFVCIPLGVFYGLAQVKRANGNLGSRPPPGQP
jgi:hypothetical protein